MIEETEGLDLLIEAAPRGSHLKVAHTKAGERAHPQQNSSRSTHHWASNHEILNTRTYPLRVQPMGSI